jgi:SAM-dependent methyltransferase
MVSFDDKWKEEREPKLYTPLTPKTQRQFFYRKYWETMLPYLPENASRILEIGCGRATLTEYLLNHYPGSTAVLVDESEEALKIARKNLWFFGKRCHFYKASAVDSLYPFKYGEVDIVVSMGVIEHLSPIDQDLFMSESRRVGKNVFCFDVYRNKNVFSRDRYERHNTSIPNDKCLNPYPLFHVPLWLDRVITKVYLFLDRFISFDNKFELCQTRLSVFRRYQPRPARIL